jgi:hypothetical protein
MADWWFVDRVVVAQVAVGYCCVHNHGWYGLTAFWGLAQDWRLAAPGHGRVCPCDEGGLAVHGGVAQPE